MEEKNVNPEERPSALFLFLKKVLADQTTIREHLRNGGKLEDIQGDFKFHMPFTAKEFNERIATENGNRTDRFGRKLNPYPLIEETDL